VLKWGICAVLTKRVSLFAQSSFLFFCVVFFCGIFCGVVCIVFLLLLLSSLTAVHDCVLKWGICRLARTIHIDGVYTVFLAGKSPNIRSYMVYTYSSGKP